MYEARLVAGGLLGEDDGLTVVSEGGLTATVSREDVSLDGEVLGGLVSGLDTAGALSS